MKNYSITIHYGFKILSTSFWLTYAVLLSSCTNMLPQHEKKALSSSRIQVKLNQYNQSAFKQVEARFFSYQSKELVYRVLSDIEKTPLWLERLDSLEVLEIYNNQHYLLRTTLNSPWPFNNRELITCVNTSFNATVTTITIYSCSERVAENQQYLRLLQVESSWTISELADSRVEIHYKTWLNPSGNVPAFIFNSALMNNAKTSLEKLQLIIEQSSLAQYPY